LSHAIAPPFQSQKGDDYYGEPDGYYGETKEGKGRKQGKKQEVVVVKVVEKKEDYKPRLRG
jgi:hypothetical protein